MVFAAKLSKDPKTAPLQSQHLDLFVVNTAEDSQLFIGDGAGGFAEAPTPGLFGSGTHAAAIDLNHDGVRSSQQPARATGSKHAALPIHKRGVA